MAGRLGLIPAFLYPCAFAASMIGSSADAAIDGRPFHVLVVPLSSEPSSCPQLSDAAGIHLSIDNGNARLSEWLADTSGYAFIAFDQNRNGIIDDAAELVSNRTNDDATGAFNVLLDLATDRAPSIPVLDARHALYAELLLWSDKNRNGRSELSELQTVPEFLGVLGLGMNLITEPSPTEAACRLKGWSVTRADWTGRPRPDDRIHPIYEVVLRTTP